MVGGGSANPAEIQPRLRTKPYGFLERFDSDFGVALFCGLVAIGLCGYRLALHDILFGVHGYSDGVYLGASILLVHGHMPYRYFAFTYPPGSTLILAPLAALSRAIGAPDAMAAARCITAVVVGVNAGLVAWCLRLRGRAAMIAGGLALATFPLAVAASQSLMLEPFAILLVLLGVSAIFAGERAPSRTRLVVGGLAFGVAGTVEIWAIIPMVLALVFVVRAVRGSRFAVALAAGFVLPQLPFFVAAPGAFVHQVFTSQLGKGAAFSAVPVGDRLLRISGLAGISVFHAGANAAIGVLAGLAAVTLVVYALGRAYLGLMEWYVVACAVLVVAAFLGLQQYYDNYAYFAAAFLSLLLGICVGHVVTALDERSARRPRGTPGVAPAAVIGVILALAVFVVIQDRSFSATYLSSAVNPSAALEAQVPPGACVIADSPSLTIAADRFTAQSASCPLVVDTYGLWLTDDSSSPLVVSNVSPALVEQWRVWLSEADYLVEVAPRSSYIPWTPSLLSWFDSHYQLITQQTGAYLYARTN